MGLPNTAVFALADLVGLDTIGHLAENSYELLTDDEARDVYQLPQFVKDMLANKMFGNKTKVGFYKSEKTPEGKRVKLVLNPKDGSHAEFDKKAAPAIVAETKGLATTAEKQKAILYGNQFAWELFANSLIYSANRIPEISDTIVEIDNAMTWGYAWEVGPFAAWDNIGVEESVKKMEADGMAVPESVKKMLASGAKSFYKVENGKEMYYDLVAGKYVEKKLSDDMIFLATLKADNKVVKSCDSASLVDLGDGVFNLEFTTKMNAINGEIVDFMGEVFDFAETNATGIVIGNQAPGIPGAFSAGGDLKFMGGLAKAGKFSEIDDFIRKVHEGLQRVRYSNIPVVAAPYGMTLGGGCEVCLAADRIVGHAELYMGLVEVGAGLLPGGGGNLNLWKKLLSAIPGPVTVSNMADLFVPAFQNIAMANVSTSAKQAQKLGYLGANDRIVMNKDYLIGEAKKEVLRMLEDGYAAPAPEKFAVIGEAGIGMINAELLNMKGAGYITEYDEVVAKKIAFVLSGGDVKQGTKLSDEEFLKNEREAFVELWKNEKTQARAEHIATTGKPLRN